VFRLSLFLPPVSINFRSAGRRLNAQTPSFFFPPNFHPPPYQASHGPPAFFHGGLGVPLSSPLPPFPFLPFLFFPKRRGPCAAFHFSKKSFLFLFMSVLFLPQQPGLSFQPQVIKACSFLSCSDFFPPEGPSAGFSPI